MKKNILITAGGTATAWHFCNVIEQYFKDDFNIIISDTNDSVYVPSSIYADKFFKVPSVYDKNYIDIMYQILEDEKIDYIIPLIDFDLFNFSLDNQRLIELGVQTTAPKYKTSETLINKENMYQFFKANNINTPRVYDFSEIDSEKEYIVKPKTGFGSIGVKKMFGSEILKNHDLDKIIIQEILNSEEITVEVFNGDVLKIFQRERVSTKSGVCVKMKPVYYHEIDEMIEKLVKIIDCPLAFCVQFMKDNDGKWCIFDCNMRIGAGTSLSTKIGFQLVRAFLMKLLNEEVTDDLFMIDNSIKAVLRVYDEVVIR